MSTKPGSTQVMKTIFVTDEEKSDFKYLSDKGVKLLIMEKPTDNAQDLAKML